MEALKVKVAGLPDAHKWVSLSFDEIAIKEEIAYNPATDTIEGITSTGTIANHAMVFMVRGGGGQFVIPTGLYSDRSIFRQVYIPTGRYSDRSLFRQFYILTGRYSDRSLFRQLLDVNYNGN